MIRKPFQFEGIEPPQKNESKDPDPMMADLLRLAKLSANLVEAHSSFIFLPQSLLKACLLNASSNRAHTESGANDLITLVASHSLCPGIIEGCSLSPEMGLIGWVARNHRSIHVSPFERDSRILGVYKDDQQLKSFIGIPVPLTKYSPNVSGVLACDSKKAFAFTKLQGKILEEVGTEIGAVVSLHLKLNEARSSAPSWESFLNKGDQLIEALGIESTTAMRIRITNSHSIYQKLGTARAIRYFEQMYRLIGQSVPPHYPLYRTPTGEILIMLDNMMNDIYENKIIALSNHTALGGVKANFDFRFRSFDSRRDGQFNLERLISETSFAEETSDRFELTGTDDRKAFPDNRKVISFR